MPALSVGFSILSGKCEENGGIRGKKGAKRDKNGENQAVVFTVR
jgi:hypothetical protein